MNLTKFAPDPIAASLKKHVKNTTPVPPLPYNKRQAFAYVAHRVPGIFACNYKALVELKMRFANFAPSTMLDFGSGPGTAVWYLLIFISARPNLLKPEHDPHFLPKGC